MSTINTTNNLNNKISNNKLSQSELLKTECTGKELLDKVTSLTGTSGGYAGSTRFVTIKT